MDKPLIKIGFVVISWLTTYGLQAGEKPISTDNPSTQTIFDSDNKTEIDRWVAVNDNVMGGISEGKATLTEDNHLLFSGSIALENNGGFASVRTLPQDFELTGYEGIRIRVKGDGRVYQFRLRSDRKFDGVAFKHDFKTIADTWMEINLPFASFLPVYRGRILRDVKPLVAADIRQMGFLIADKVAGPFCLIVDEIKAYR